VLKLNEASWEVMRGQRQVRLVQLVRRKRGEKAKKSTADEMMWEGVDEDLFTELKALRRRLAEQRRVPPYIIFPDTVLRHLARTRPLSLDRMRQVPGIGDAKLRDFGETFLHLLQDYGRRKGLAVEPAAPPEAGGGSEQAEAFALFRSDLSINAVVEKTGWSRSRVYDLLCDFVRETRPASLEPWLTTAVEERVRTAVQRVGTERLKPIHTALGGAVSYDDIRLALVHLLGTRDRTA
jgi:ATP-dependent DNA helicase RecQ